MNIPTPTPSTQRVVLLHTNGPFAGLRQIIGHRDELDGEVPSHTSGVFDILPGRRKGSAVLIASKPRFLLYQEVKQ